MDIICIVDMAFYLYTKHKCKPFIEEAIGQEMAFDGCMCVGSHQEVRDLNGREERSRCLLERDVLGDKECSTAC